MEQKILDKYVFEGIMQYFMNAGAGRTGSHSVVTNSVNYTAADDEYVYAIEMYTDGVTFTTLTEDGTSVGATRLAGGDSGYPQGTIITGKFDSIVPASGAECGIYIKRSS